ncbi:MAG: hypothetical protein K1X71_08835 [Pirellulales bacterium]|nr:hypothetical protein [Pirellulales bacterium]
MSSNQRIIVFALLSVVLGMGNVLLLPMDDADRIAALFVLGFMTAEPALLGLWGVFGTAPPAVRVTGAFYLSGLCALTWLLGVASNRGRVIDAETFVQMIVMAVAICGAAQFIGWWLRRYRGWRLVASGGSDGALESERRFRLAHLLGWITLLSATFALWGFVPIVGKFDGSLLDEMFMVLVFVMATWQIVPLFGLVLAQSHRARLLAIWVATCAINGAAVYFGYTRWWWVPPDVREVFSLMAGPLTCTLLVALVARASGLRLYQPLAGDVLPAPLEPGESAGKASPLRFAALIGCVAALGALVLLLEGRG